MSTNGSNPLYSSFRGTIPETPWIAAELFRIVIREALTAVENVIASLRFRVMKAESLLNRMTFIRFLKVVDAGSSNAIAPETAQ
jgi:hypothetical protein